MSEASDDLNGEAGAQSSDAAQRLAMLEHELHGLMRLVQALGEGSEERWTVQARLKAATSELQALSRRFGKAPDGGVLQATDMEAAMTSVDDRSDADEFELDRHADDASFAYGVTMDQFDALDRLIQLIGAHGDVLSTLETSGLARGTLATLGQAIFDNALEVRRILEEVEDQGASRPAARVGDERAVYGPAPAQTWPWPKAWPMPSASRAAGLQSAVCLH